MLFYLIIIFVLLSSLILFVLPSKIKGKDENTILKSRKSQLMNNILNSKLKNEMEKILTEKAEADKKYKIESMCLRANVKYTYGEFKLISLIATIMVPILMYISTQNMYLIPVCVIIGYLLPGEIIKIKANNRVKKLNNQSGAFLQVVIERYKFDTDMTASIIENIPNFKNIEPLYSILIETQIEISTGITTADALDTLARKTGNKYLIIFADYYRNTNDIELNEDKIFLMKDAYTQYDDSRKLMFELKEKISGYIAESYFILAALPLMVIYQIFTSTSYLKFMLHTATGQIGCAGIMLVVIFSVWFINTKLAKPID